MMRFDEHSFQDEIQNKADAQTAYRYLTQNLQEFQRELYEAGLDHDQSEEKLMQVWKNFIQSADRVGFTNRHIEDIKEHLGSST